MTYRVLELLGEDRETLPEACPPEVLESFAPDQAEEVREIYGELRELYKAGQLYSEDDYAQFADRMVSSPLKAMCLHVSHDCNLRCRYCFA